MFVNICDYALLLPILYTFCLAKSINQEVDDDYVTCKYNATATLENQNQNVLLNKRQIYKPEDALMKTVFLRTVLRRVLPQEKKRNSTSKCHSWDNKQHLSSMIQLINYIAGRYLYGCITGILYDDFFQKEHHDTLGELLRSYPLPYVHGHLDLRKQSTLQQPKDAKCLDLLVLGHNLETSGSAVGNQDSSHVLMVTAPGTSRFTVLRFLASPQASRMVNLLILRPEDEEIHLYAHRIYVDGLGSSEGHIVTTWRCGHLTRSHVPLFDASKFRYGLGGHRFLVATGQQPPYVIDRGDSFKGGSKNSESSWDGMEIRVLWLMAEMLNFTLEFYESPGASNLAEAGEAVIKELMLGRADIGVASLYMTPERMRVVTMSAHSQDCATFMTSASTAMPKYRAIMGPFHWTVWLALTSAYLLAVFPIAFSASHSLKHLLTDPWEIENMFWYVFGTFTNCFTFRGKHSWRRTDKSATRMLIGWYWVFSIIVTACYTGSIIAFVTLPVFPEMIDTSQQILEQDFLVGMLAKSGWQDWFNNSSDPLANSLMKKMEYLPDLHSAFVNVSQRYYYHRGYAFLGSQHVLQYFIVTNHTKNSSKSLLHLGAECFVPFNVGLAFPKHAPYSNIMGNMLLRIIQHGFIQKLTRDMEWSMKSYNMMVFATPSLRTVRAVERKLTLEDVQGMFLLLGAGFAIAFMILFVEIGSWAFKKLKLRFSKQKQSDLDYMEEPDKITKAYSTTKHQKERNSKSMSSHHYVDQEFQVRANQLQFLIRGQASMPSPKVPHYKRPHSMDDYLLHKNFSYYSQSMKQYLNKGMSKNSSHQQEINAVDIKPSTSDNNNSLPPMNPITLEGNTEMKPFLPHINISESTVNAETHPVGNEG